MSSSQGAENAAPRGPVVVVTGPTASGKSSLAISLCQAYGGEIVNADSMQVYRFMDIGTGKPSAEQRGRVPHHLFDVVDPNDRYSAGRYATRARRIAEAIHGRGRLVVLVGGTGLYIRAFLEGLIQGAGADPELRETLEADHERAVREGDSGRLHRRLQEADRKAAERIHPNDARRVVRALEIHAIVGEPASALRDRHGFADRPYPCLHLAVDPGREPLNERIDRRCEEMIEGGLLQEVRALRGRGFGADLAPMRAIGYRHINPVVDGVETLANALAEMQRDTRQFARRQRTWLRAVPEAVWLSPDEPGAIERAVEAFLEGNPLSPQGA